MHLGKLTKHFAAPHYPLANDQQIIIYAMVGGGGSHRSCCGVMRLRHRVRVLWVNNPMQMSQVQWRNEKG